MSPGRGWGDRDWAGRGNERAVLLVSYERNVVIFFSSFSFHICQ